MSASVNSPFSLLYRWGDILLGNSSGTPKIFKYDFNGGLIGAFTSTTLNFVQQMIKNTNGNIIACEFSGTGSVVRQIYTSSNLQYIDVFDKTLTTVGNNNSVPFDYKLYDNYPNPFNPVTKISFSIPKNEYVITKIFDIMGREVDVLVNKEFSAGVYTIDYNASNLSSGIYFYRITSGNFSETKKMSLIK